MVVRRASRGRRVCDAVDDAARAMQHAAQTFVDATRGVTTFAYGADSVATLEEWLGRLADARPPREVVQSIAVAAGAYLGEVLVRAGKGSWTNEAGGWPALRLQSENTLVFPIDKVGKRLTLGPEHDVRPFFRVAWAGPIRSPLPPGVTAVVSAPLADEHNSRATNVY